jgi:hypothetical protein
MMIALWTVASLDYYLISFYLKYVPGNIFVNGIVSTSSEIVANFTAGIVFSYFGAKISFCSGCGISAIGGFLIAFTPAENTYLVAFFVLLAKFGIAMCF